MSRSATQNAGIGRSDRFSALILVFLCCSALLHALAFSALNHLSNAGDSSQSNKPMELVTVEVEAPKPAPPAPKEEPKPELPRVRPKPPPIKIAESQKRPEPDRPRPPPPPNDAPPPESKPTPLVVGISMSSTTTAGAFAAPVGNTLYGKSPDKAPQPKDVKSYDAPKFAPIYQVDSEPVVVGEVKIPYPEDSRRAGIEGAVILSISIDSNGSVTAAKVLQGPHPSLSEAALQAIRRFKFKPAIKNGQPVSTELKYTYTFLLD